MILKNVEELISTEQMPIVGVDETIFAACQKMTEVDERALSVMSGDVLVGVLSEKDVIQKGVAAGVDLSSASVEQIMTSNPITIEADDSVAHAIDKMADGGFHHLPVMKNGAFVGMIYSDDIPEEYKLLLEHYKELKGS